MKRMFLSLAGLSLVAAAPAGAASAGKDADPQTKPATAAADAPKAEATKAEPKICRKYESTESRAKRNRVCLTREEWKKLERTN